MSEPLSHEVGRLAGRLADFLTTAFPRAAGALARNIDFLRANGVAAAGESAAEPLGEPLDRLAARLGLSALERDFLLLAGMPEEHEGYALAMRTLHPRGEPRPSVALAAQFLGGDGSRGAFLRWLEASALRRSGAVRLVGDAPYFERSIELEESLWLALHGCDPWPSASGPRPAAPGWPVLREWLESEAMEKAGGRFGPPAVPVLPGGWEMTRPTATWDQLVLSREREDVLRAALARLSQQRRVFDEWGFLRNRPGSRGVRLLFSGPPGTGKTLAAEVLAAERKTALLGGNLSWLLAGSAGETEQNLAAVFDVAARWQASLFFDEAEVLFGRRTVGQNAAQQPADLAAASLLTRLQRFAGLAVFTTSQRRNLDLAFLRRLEFAVDFPDPDGAERHRIWRCHVPDEQLLAGDVDLHELAAAYPLVGSLIRHAAVAAAFQAAADGSKITRRHFVHAVRQEYERHDLAFPESSGSLAG